MRVRVTVRMRMTFSHVSEKLASIFGRSTKSGQLGALELGLRLELWEGLAGDDSEAGTEMCVNIEQSLLLIVN